MRYKNFLMIGAAGVLILNSASHAVYGQQEQPGQQQQQPGQQPEQQQAITGLEMYGMLRSVDTERQVFMIDRDRNLEQRMQDSGRTQPGRTQQDRDGMQQDRTQQNLAQLGMAQPDGAQRNLTHEDWARGAQRQQPGGQQAELDRNQVFHYTGETEVTGAINNIQGLTGKADTPVRVEYRTEGTRAIAEKIEVLDRKRVEADGTDWMGSPMGDND